MRNKASRGKRGWKEKVKKFRLGEKRVETREQGIERNREKKEKREIGEK